MKKPFLSVLLITTFLSIFPPTRLIGQFDIDKSRDRSASIQGRVVNAQGAPLSADVMVYGRAIIDGRVDLFAMCSTATDVEGKYTCADLRPGEYIVSIMAKAPAATKQGKTPPLVSAPRTFFPGTPSLADAAPVELAHGTVGIADVVLPQSEPGRIQGKLVGAPLKPSFLFRAYYGHFELPFDAQVNYNSTTGIFTVPNLPPGSFSLSADWWIAGGMHHEYGIADVLAGRDAILSTREVDRHSVKGKLHFTDEFGQKSYPPTISLLGLGQQSGWHLEATVESDGSFQFSEITDGDYALQIKTSSGWYVDSISGVASQAGSDILRLKPGTAITEIVVLLKETTARVSGKVNAEEVIPMKTGVVLQSFQDGTLSTASVDQYGQFGFANLPAGDYKIFAWKDLSQAEFRNPDVLSRQKKYSLEVHLDNDSNLTNVEASLIPSSR